MPLSINAMSESTDVASLRQKLISIGQSDVLRFWDQLDEPGKKKLVKQLSSLDLDGFPPFEYAHEHFGCEV